MDKISTRASDDLPTAGTQEGAETELAISVSGTEEVNGARFPPGRIFASRYRIVTRLGRGGMGEVYRADDLKLGQAVALKLLATHEGPSVRRFVREVRLARGVTHPNVCRVYDIGEAEAWHYLSMEYVDGETLESLQTRIGVLPTPKAIDIARQLCAGVAAAHERGVLHRDLKPSNIMLDSRGRVRIMDFGLAVRSGDWGGGEIVGTPAYMAPEQFIGEEATEQTDLYALGLVLYELFTGRKPFPARTLEDRMRQALASDPPLLPSSIGHAVADVIRACLKRNRAERPRTALDVAAALPGGDLLAAALAEGRIPSPDIVAAAGRKGALAPRVGWALLAPVVLGTFLVAANGASLTFAPADVPKPPEALAERSRAILTSLGHTDHAADSTYSFITVPGTGRSRLRFVYRESPLPLVPQNLFHVVTASDPPLDLGGMATVTLDTSGQLIVFSRFIDSADERNRGVTPSTMFAEAGLSEGDFVAITPARRPAVPHDSAMAWVRGEDANKIRVSSATLGGAPVYFEVAAAGAAVGRSRVFSTRRTPTAEALLSLVIVAWLASTSVMARHNLRAGESDVTGAFKLSLFTFAAGVSAAMLRSHHVANPVDEVILLLGAGGWCLVFAALNWLSYVSFEPHVRRLWPRTLISWARLLSGRFRDPLVGRDVLVGIFGGVVLAVSMLLRFRVTGREPSELWVGPALESLGSGREFAFTLGYVLLDGIQYALGGLLCLLLLRLLLRKTWLAAACWMPLSVLLVAGTSPSGADLAAGALAGVLAMTMIFRIGLLANVVMLVTERLFTRLPLTLDPNAWYVGSSLLVLVVILAAATYGFRVALAGRSAFGSTAS